MMLVSGIELFYNHELVNSFLDESSGMLIVAYIDEYFNLI